MSDIDKSYYECKRCLYKCYQLIDMKKHLNKKYICKREFKSYDYDEDKLNELSLIRHYNYIKKIDNVCKNCNKIFLNSSNLNRHIKSYCKKTKNNHINNIEYDHTIEIDDDTNQKTDKNISISNKMNDINDPSIDSPIDSSIHSYIDMSIHSSIDTSIDPSNKTNDKIHEKNHSTNKNDITKKNKKIRTNMNNDKYINIENNYDKNYLTNIDTQNIDTQNNIDTLNNITNNITNNINLNIKLINSFDKDWNTEHIDEKTKLILLLNNSKFTSTLENILENEVNLNVLIDNTSNNGLVYMDNDIKHLTIKDIVKKIMEKLHKHINDFKNDVSKLNVNSNIIKSEIEVANEKYNEFNKSDEVQDHVKTCITSIYNKKKDDTVSVYKSIKQGY
jgi:hypothetical protein